MPYVIKNNAASTLAAALSAVATSATVQAGAGALFAVTAPDYTYLTLDDGAGTIEVIKLTARAVDVLTIERGLDGTSAVAWDIGDVIECRPCRLALRDAISNAAADIASAATIDLSAATGNIARITGTITTSAWTINVGQRVVCVAVGAWPLTYHAANNPLPGSVNYTCAAGDLVIVSKDGNGDLHVEIVRRDGTAVSLGSFTLAQLNTAVSDADVARTDAANTFTGAQSFPDGAAATPSIAHAGDANTGMWFPAADTVAWSTAGVERMQINSGGNVGINITTGAQFGVKGNSSGKTVSQLRAFDTTSTPMVVWERSDGAVAAQLKYDGAGFMAIGTTTAHPFVLLQGDVEAARIDASKNLLVTTPALLGYGTGAGGTVTQGSSSGKATTLTLNKPCGQITMNNAALAAGAQVEFGFNNSTMAATDVLILSMPHNTHTRNYSLGSYVGAAGGYISVKNETAGSLSEAVVINFAIIKGATS